MTGQRPASYDGATLPFAFGLAQVGGLVCKQRPATLSSGTARRQYSARNEAQPL